jgi:hypothetical protein
MHHSLSLHPPHGFLGVVVINDRRSRNGLEAPCGWNDPYDPTLRNVPCWVAFRGRLSASVALPRHNGYNRFQSLLDGVAGRYNGAQPDRLL